jgi:tetratricopeptide (TPR) repeat protein
MSARALLRTIRGLTPTKIDERLGRERVVRRAHAYVSEGRVEEVWLDRDALRAHISGSSDTPYHTIVRFREGDIEAQCSCPYERGECWHVGALLLQLITEPELLDELEEQVGRGGGAGAGAGGGRSAAADDEDEPDARPEGMESAPARPAPGAAGEGGFAGAADEVAMPDAARIDALRDDLLSWPKTELADLISAFAQEDPVFFERVRDSRGEPSDLDLKLFRRAASSALRPGTSVGRYETFRVAEDLREISTSVRRLVEGGKPEEALSLLIEIAWMTWQRAGEADDREAALVGFVRETLEEWLGGWAAVSGRDRQQIARELFGWIMEDGAGVTDGLILRGREALGDIGMEELHRLLRPIAKARRETRPAAVSVDEGPSFGDPVRRRVRGALRELAAARSDLEGFLEQCGEDDAQGADLLAAVRRLADEGQLEEAARWADRGRAQATGTVRDELEDLRVRLLPQLGRHREAIDSAWEIFRHSPDARSYHRLLSAVTEESRGSWRRRALDHVEASSDATAFVEVCVAAEDMERLAHRLEIASGFVLAAGHRALESAATALERTRPEASAEIYARLGTAILEAGDAQRLFMAHTMLERAGQAFGAAGREQDWQTRLDGLRRAHAVVRRWYPDAGGGSAEPTTTEGDG